MESQGILENPVQHKTRYHVRLEYSFEKIQMSRLLPYCFLPMYNHLLDANIKILIPKFMKNYNLYNCYEGVGGVCINIIENLTRWLLQPQESD